MAKNGGNNPALKNDRNRILGASLRRGFYKALFLVKINISSMNKARPVEEAEIPVFRHLSV